ncbi:hypothetical protein BVC80_8977g19 [Macleaya cordata]|uniref:Uncharacterized protein n=1 Tax=Macleaya cordata TaxID=56857 RepID=A0A200PYG5_MACCD|nr:hypothetical protein BVC80_8977g19 [Macleaya cordata]
MGFSCGDDGLDKKVIQVPLRVEIGSSVGFGGGQGVEPESEFKPIGHPLEPSDEDHPVKCPVPDSSVLNDGEMKERFTESMRRRAELPSVDDQSMIVVAMEPDPARAVRKRHHTLTCDHTTPPVFRGPPLPPLPPQNTTIFQVLQQCNEFES